MTGNMLHKTSLKPPPVFIFLNFNLLQSIVLALIRLESSWIFTTSLTLKTSEPLHPNITQVCLRLLFCSPLTRQSDQMPLLSDQELRAIVDRIRYLETELKEAKTLVTVLESNLMAAKKPDLNAGNEGVAGLGGDRLRGLVTANLKTGESDITMIENEKGRFMKLTMGPILIPASEFA
ncbi:hypothetical protein FOPG_10018 [Fusarium oxysporum f. sp. conglutinans race 2 54008]|uniref:Uncharacterized protein n=1 Tax=Fusarium oxysporum f. sp. conglutinans race 2 54008 TaxID=1089457 RepID=X0HTD7_FUSOX|nr:hypothetical protein FOPG_10018 [Fusarium oxysporum f. sp. conglutinans race 2 54008]